jgi:hypothetical protein
VQRLRAASTELQTRQEQINDQVARLPLLEEQHRLAVASVAQTDADLDHIWVNVDRELNELCLQFGKREANPIQQGSRKS